MKRLLGIFIVLSSLIFISGCTSEKEVESTAETKLKAEETPFTWRADRDTPFTINQYKTSEEEALMDLKKKYEVELLPSFFEAQQLFREQLAVAGATEEAPTYDFDSQENRLKLTMTQSYKDEQGNYLSYGRIEVEYQYLELLKKVKLSSQKISLYNWTENGTYKGKDLDVTLTTLGDILKIKDVEAELVKFTKNTANPEALKGKDMVIYEDFQQGEKQRTFGKSFGVEYDKNGVLSRIYGYTLDYRI